MPSGADDEVDAIAAAAGPVTRAVPQHLRSSVDQPLRLQLADRALLRRWVAVTAGLQLAGDRLIERLVQQRPIMLIERAVEPPTTIEQRRE
ncbi:MAG: hypothetical protein AB7O92_16145, partial [Acidimicrobiia bacterium]